MTKHKPKIAKYKKEEVTRLDSLLQKYKVIAIADMTNMPSLQLQKMRSSLKDSVLITMSKGRIIRVVFDKLKDKVKGIAELEKYIRGMPALLLTNDSPFKLSKILKKSKSAAPAKAGQIAPNDIVVPAGPTSFPPGPIIGELGQLGIKAAVEEGKIAVKADKVVVKEGEVISSPVAAILTRLGIEPMEIGINLLAALENEVIFTKDVLNVDEEEYLNNIKLAAQNVFNLTYSIAYPTKDNIKLLLQKVSRESEALADSQSILTGNNVKKQLGKANLGAESLKGKLNLPEEVKEEKKTKDASPKTPKEEPKKEEKKPEVKKEEPKPKVEEKKVEPKKEEAPKPEVKKEEKKVEEKKVEKPKEEPKKEAPKPKAKDESPKTPKPDTQKPKEETPKVDVHKKEEKPKSDIQKEEQAAQNVLKKLQDEKLAKSNDLPERDKSFELEEKMAKDILKKMQDEKMKKS